mmetsp:Transcript_8493/g.4625  ORF Transcript_8493/g.4625 Transcript_8493/m.4625 type:complete len:88 (+) Transcript_8493:83-346(+)
MSITRINIHKGKKLNQIEIKKNEIAHLLKNGNEDLAKIKVESVLKDENANVIYDITNLMCEVCSERVEFLISKQMALEIPVDMYPHL